MNLTFARDFDKRLTPTTAIHYQAGHTYDVPADLVAEVQPFVEGAPDVPEPATAVPVTHEPEPEHEPDHGEG